MLELGALRSRRGRDGLVDLLKSDLEARTSYAGQHCYLILAPSTVIRAGDWGWLDHRFLGSGHLQRRGELETSISRFQEL